MKKWKRWEEEELVGDEKTEEVLGRCLVFGRDLESLLDSPHRKVDKVHSWDSLVGKHLLPDIHNEGEGEGEEEEEDESEEEEDQHEDGQKEDHAGEEEMDNLIGDLHKLERNRPSVDKHQSHCLHQDHNFLPLLRVVIKWGLPSQVLMKLNQKHVK